MVKDSSIFATKIPKQILKLEVSLVYVIVTNLINWYMVNLQSDRENTVNLKTKTGIFKYDARENS